MLFEGIYLYLMVVKVFNIVVRMRLFYAFAWGKYVLENFLRVNYIITVHYLNYSKQKGSKKRGKLFILSYKLFLVRWNIQIQNILVGQHL